MKKIVSMLGVFALSAGVLLSAGEAAIAETDVELPNPLLHYSFDEGTTDIVDDTGNGNDATLLGSGGTFSNGKLILPGGNSGSDAAYVQIPTGNLAGQENLTISMWLKNSTGNGNYAAASIGNTSTNKGYWLFNPANPSGYVKSVLTTASANASSGSPWSTEIGAGSTGAPTASHASTSDLALYTTVIDGTNGKLTSYLNGQEISSVNTSVSVADYGDADDLRAYIGRSAYSDKFFQGEIADYTIYASALDASQVHALLAKQADTYLEENLNLPETVETDFKLAVSSLGFPVTWQVLSGEAITIEDSNGTTWARVVRPSYGQADGQVSLQATVDVNGTAVTLEYQVCVNAETTSDQEKLDSDVTAVSIDNAENMRNNFSVPLKGQNGSAISWEIVDAGVAGAILGEGENGQTQTVSVQRPSAGSATSAIRLKATFEFAGLVATKEFSVIVQPMPSDADQTEAYVWAYFTGEGSGAECVSLAASKGNDALAWNSLNAGEPVFTSTEGTEGLRDPFILRSKDGDKFYLIATDLKIDGLDGGFTTAQLKGSKYIEIWESDDLVNWSNQRHVKVSSDFAGNTWAPEAYWNEDLGKYMVYWASNLYDTTDESERTSLTYNRMMYVTTEDFVSFSEPQVWVDVDQSAAGEGFGTIDVTVTQVDGTYYRFIKDEGTMQVRQESSTDLTAVTQGTLSTTEAAEGTWKLLNSAVGDGLANGVAGSVFSKGEGPNIFKANSGDVNNYEWFLFIDQPSYHGGPDHYVPFATNDIASGTNWVSAADKLKNNLPVSSDGGKPRHGTVIPVTRAEYQEVLESYQPNIAVASVSALSATTSAGLAPVLPTTVELTMKDGSVKSVDVVWESVSSTEYASVGEFTVAGIAQDDSRMPVEVVVTVGVKSDADTSLSAVSVAGLEVDLTTTELSVLANKKTITAEDIVVVTNDPESTSEIDISDKSISIKVVAADHQTEKTYQIRIITQSAHYNMSHSGSQLTDVSGNGRNGTLVGGLNEGSFSDLGTDRVLSLANNGYVTLPQGLVTAADNNFTVEMTLNSYATGNHFAWVLGDGVGAWNTYNLGNHLFVNSNSAQSGYNGQILSAIRVKTGDGNGESRLPAGGATNSGFSTITFVSEGQKLKLFLDGELISSLDHSFSLSSIVPDGDVLGYIGRSLYAGDAELTGIISDVKFWDEALTDVQVQQSMPTTGEKADLNWNLVKQEAQAKMLGDNESIESVTKKLSFPTKLLGIPVQWSISDSSLIAEDGTVTRPNTDTNVSVTVQTDAEHTQTFELTVKAVSEQEVAAKVEADLDAIVLKDRTTENLPLAVSGSVNGSAITWTSSDINLVSETDLNYESPQVGSADPYAGGGLIARPAYGDGDAQVTVTASATLGGITSTREFEVVVAEKGRTAPDTGYAAAYFKSDSDEKIYQAATTENDFFTFTEVNGGNPTIVSTTDTQGLRDPYILRSSEGDKYYMVATDLQVSSAGWGNAQSQGSLKIEVWESTDLVNWVRTNGENEGIVVNQPQAGMTWAPEAYWDDELQSYVVFFSSRLYSDESHSNDNDLYARVFYVITRDFTTFTYPPQEWQNTGYARIDSTVMKIGSYYYRFTKNEDSTAADGLERGKDIFLERSKVLTSTTTSTDWNGDPETTWQLVDTAMTTPLTGNAGEGPEIFKLNVGDPNNTENDDGYVFLVDNYSDGGYVPFVTTGEAIVASSQDSRLSLSESWTAGSKAGLPSSPRHGAFVNVSQRILDALHSWSGLEAVDSTTSVNWNAEGRSLVAEVAAADQGQVAGTVTFSADGWAETVKVASGEGTRANSLGVSMATVVVPNNISGTITAKYNGYSDAAVNPSSAEAEIKAALEPSTEPSVEPTGSPSSSPSAEPSDVPTSSPTATISSSVTPTAGTATKTGSGLARTGASMIGLLAILVVSLAVTGGLMVRLRRQDR